MTTGYSEKMVNDGEVYDGNPIVRDLTVNELRDMLREVSGGDPDVGLELRPEVVEELLKAQRENRRTVSHQQLMSALGQNDPHKISIASPKLKKRYSIAIAS